MIPKILHYCWYGKPIETNWLATRCLSTWKKLGCQLMRWDETSCKFNENNYVQNAFKNNKWAHLSDYYRLKGVYDMGGAYMDTDVFVSKAIPEWFFKQKLVICFQYDDALSTAFFMAEKHSPVIKKILDLYDGMDANYNSPNNQMFTEFFRKEYPNFLFDGKRQCLGDGVWVFPKTYFDSPTLSRFTRGGYSKHMFMASWTAKGSSQLRHLIMKVRLYLPLFDLCYQTIGRKRMISKNSFYKDYIRDKNIP